MAKTNSLQQRARKPGASIRNATDTSSTRVPGDTKARKSATSPTSTRESDDSEIPIDPAPFETTKDPDPPITQRDFRVGVAVAAVILTAVGVAIPFYVNSAKVETKVDFLKETAAKTEQKVDKLFEDTAGSKSKIQTLENRMDKVESAGSPQTAKSIAKAR